MEQATVTWLGPSLVENQFVWLVYRYARMAKYFVAARDKRARNLLPYMRASNKKNTYKYQFQCPSGEKFLPFSLSIISYGD